MHPAHLNILLELQGGNLGYLGALVVRLTVSSWCLKPLVSLWHLLTKRRITFWMWSKFGIEFGLVYGIQLALNFGLMWSKFGKLRSPFSKASWRLERKTQEGFVLQVSFVMLPALHSFSS